MSVHGDKPSAKFANPRRASIETKFIHALGSHVSKTLSMYYQFGPFLIFLLSYN